MIKILHFFKTYIPDTFGGTESFIHQLCENGEQYGFKSEVLHISPRGSSLNEKLDNHIVHRAKRNIQLFSTDISIEAINKFSRIVEEHDIIHVHAPWPFMDIVLKLTKVKKPIVLTYHSDIVRQKYLAKLYSPLMHSTLKKVDAIIATSPNYLQSSKVLSQHQEKCTVIPFGLNKKHYQTSEEKLQYWKNKFNEKFILFVGKLRYYKGLNYLLEANKDNKYTIVIVGNDGNEKELKKQKNELNLTNVHFLGQLPNEDKVALLQLCYFFVFPSHLRSEAFGISLLEASMFGKAMLTCDIGTGSSFVNIENETGLYAKPECARDLRKKIDQMFNNHKTTCQMGKNAKKRFDCFFNIEKMVESYSKLYKEIIK